MTNISLCTLCTANARDGICMTCSQPCDACECTQFYRDKPATLPVRSVRTSERDANPQVTGTSSLSDNGEGSVRSVRTDDDDLNLLAGIRDGEWLSKQVFPPLRFLIPGIVPEGLTVLAGSPKVGKSWIVLDWLLAIASGGLAMGAVDVGKPRDVLYMALEDGDRRMQDRCRALLGFDDIPGRFQYVTKVTPAALVPTIGAWLGVFTSGMVVVDTLGKVLPPTYSGETPYARDYRIMSHLKDITDEWPGSSVLVNHHDRKAVTADFVEAVSGTNGIAGGADTVLVLTRDRQQPEGLIQVTGRDVTEGAYALTFKSGIWTLDGGSLDGAAKTAEIRRAEMGVGERSREVIEALARHGGPASPAEIAEIVGMSNDDAGKYLRRLTDTGRVQKAGRGKYADARAGVPQSSR